MQFFHIDHHRIAEHALLVMFVIVWLFGIGNFGQLKANAPDETTDVVATRHQPLDAAELEVGAGHPFTATYGMIPDHVAELLWHPGAGPSDDSVIERGVNPIRWGQLLCKLFGMHYKLMKLTVYTAAVSMVLFMILGTFALLAGEGEIAYNLQGCAVICAAHGLFAFVMYFKYIIKWRELF